MLNQINAATSGLISRKKKEYSTNPYFSEAMEAGISPLNFKALNKFVQQKNVDDIASSQEKYQSGLKLRNEALSKPKAMEPNEAKTVSTDLNSGPAETSNIRNGVPIPPPSNTQGNAKPLFDPEFEKKATFLAGSQDQADAAGY